MMDEENTVREQGVTIITVTNRPHYLRNIMANYKRQRWKDKELIIVLNNDKMKMKKYEDAAKALPGVTVYRTPGVWPLGRCLNFGVRRAAYDYIAKFDDDDFYSSYYLTETMKRFDQTDADIVGKRRFYLYFEAKKALVKGKMAGSKQVAGATLVIKKDIFSDVKFSRVRKGSDMRFLKECVKAGYLVETTGVYNFAAVRRRDQRTHTWKVTKRTMRWLKAKVVARTRNYQKRVTRIIN